MNNIPRVLAVLLAVPIAIAGCGSSTKSQSTTAAAAGQSSSTSAPAGPYGAGASTTAAPSTSAQTVLISTKSQRKLGTVLAAGPKHLTVYLFEADKAGHSACSGQCASVWPPVLGGAKSAGGAKAALLGTIKLPDGRTQVTYKGHPLYYYARDKDDGDAYGQAIKSFGAGWYVLRPSGSKLDNS